ncbi:hypothetical protein [Streptomyces sp. F001]|uniref:hypothetical protein n=1 Tax=Streptomyces sp. F001 TaxID=1510026 RepID=UPI00101E2A03|nr:hypothetical protein [Streptomyces sp. F001]
MREGTLEDGGVVVARGFGGSQDCGQGVPGGLGENLLGVGGRDLADCVGVAVDRVWLRFVSGEGSQGGGGGLVVGGLQVDEGLAGGGDLPIVVAPVHRLSDPLVELAGAHTDMTSHQTVSAGQPLDPTVRTTAGHDTDEDGAERA